MRPTHFLNGNYFSTLSIILKVSKFVFKEKFFLHYRKYLTIPTITTFARFSSILFESDSFSLSAKCSFYYFETIVSLLWKSSLLWWKESIFAVHSIFHQNWSDWSTPEGQIAGWLEKVQTYEKPRKFIKKALSEKTANFVNVKKWEMITILQVMAIQGSDDLTDKKKTSYSKQWERNGERSPNLLHQ